MKAKLNDYCESTFGPMIAGKTGQDLLKEFKGQHQNYLALAKEMKRLFISLEKYFLKYTKYLSTVVFNCITIMKD
jgi:hypothetical protein